jgi:hypothetical protein
MVQDQPLELSEDEKKALSIGLIREWWIGAINALVDTVGSESALAHMKPYFVNAGRAGQAIYLQLVGRPADDILAAFSGMAEPVTSMFDADGDRIWVCDDGSLIWEIFGCSLKGECKEACTAFCDYSLSEAHPPLEGHLLESRAFGDASCLWIWHSEGRPPRVDRADRFLLGDDARKRFRVPDELFGYLGMAYLGEFWVMTTRAFIECVGSEQATNQLIGRMGRSGRSLGVRSTGLLLSSESSIDRTARIIELIQSLHHMKCRTIRSKQAEEGYVDECPFSGSPCEICLQYQAFFNGICEALDPSYEFAYDSMMTKGDQTCHWTIRKRGEPTKEKLDEVPSPDGPIERLTNKYIDGEITKEEYEEKMLVIRKQYPR